MSVTTEGPELLLTAGETAVVLEKSPNSVWQYERGGILPAAFKTRRGVRLFRIADVDKFKRERAGK